ncbi:MAG: ribbon-helix-helix protein, CopG family [bacterium]|nr:ribbon-helix-helix protein, CopG family [bacterium]
MRTTRPITVSLPTDLLREAQRVAREESRTRSALVREALQQYLASARWQRLRRWGAETAERMGIRTEEDLQRLLDKVATGRRRGGA